MLGAFIVDYKGYRVGVGSGLSDSERKDFWQRKESLLGVKIEIDTFGETKNKDGSLSLNCAIYKGLRFDKVGTV
jgi:DNA ligase-1